jgi:hypothetical protein
MALLGEDETGKRMARGATYDEALRTCVGSPVSQA